jgi:hypothetical protein
MFSGLVRFITSFAVVCLAYFAYRLLLVPFIEPSVRERATRPETSVTATSNPRQAELQALFAPGSWELDKPKVLETDEGMLFFKELREVDELHLELTPLTIVLTTDNDADDKKAAGTKSSPRYVVLQAAQGAVLTFDEPLNLPRGQIGRLSGGRLSGAVTIRSPESRPGAGDAIAVATRDVQVTRERIVAPHDVKFRYGPSYGAGRDLILTLDPPPKKNSGNGEKVDLGSLRSLELVDVDRVHLQLDDPDFGTGQQADVKKAESIPVEITCQGPFRHDFKQARASFQDHVLVRRLNPEGPPDQLNCHTLAIWFVSRDRQPAARQTAKDADPSRLVKLKVGRIEARGSPVVLHAPSFAAAARAEVLEYDFQTRKVRIDDSQKVLLQHKQYEVETRRLEYQIVTGGGLGQLRADGPGRLTGAVEDDPSQTFEAVWNDRVVLQPHNGDHALSLLAGAAVRYHGMGEFAARNVHVWIRQVAEPKPARGKPKFRYLPVRMLAEGDVRVDSWQLAAAVQKAEVWVRHEEATPASPTKTASGTRKNLANSKPRRPDQKFDLVGDHLQLQLVGRKKETLVEHLIVEGQVRFRELAVQDGDAIPLGLTGDVVQLDHANTPHARVRVQGGPAEVAARGLRLVGGNIQLNRGSNRLWIVGSGEMTLPARNLRPPQSGEPSPTATAASTPVTVAWKERMDFDGQLAKFQKDVQVRGVQRSERGEVFDWLATGQALCVTLTQRINFAADKQDTQDVDVHELAFTGEGGVSLQNNGSQNGRRTSTDQMQVRDLTIEQSTGRMHAHGPGWGSSVRYDNGSTERPFASLRSDATEEPRLVYVGVRFEDEMVGNLTDRELEFRGRVRSTYGPVEAWEQALNADPPDGPVEEQYLLASDRLAVIDMGSRTADEPAQIELVADGNASLEGQSFLARGWRISYARSKNLVVLQGDGRTDAELWRKGSTTPTAKLQEIRFWTHDNSIQLDSFQSLELSQFSN